MSMMDTGASGATSIANTLLQLMVTIARDLVRFAVRTSGQLANGSLHAAGALLKGAQERANRGQVGLSRFTQLAQSREPVHVTDREVAKILRAELKKHGVTFAVEKHLDGSMTYHADGKDATIVAHALEQAEQRVDALNRSRSEALERGEAIPAGDEHHVIELTDEQASQLASELREHGQALQQDGRADDAAKVEALADAAEQTRTVPADAESLELVEAARAAQGGAREEMRPVQEAIADEQATIEAEPYHALVDPSIDPEQVTTQTQVFVSVTEEQAQQLAEAVREHPQQGLTQAGEVPAADVQWTAAAESIVADVEVNQAVELTPQNTEVLHDTFERQGWRAGADGETPEAMRDIVETVDTERGIQHAAAAEVDRPQQPAPVVDAPTQAVPAVAERDSARSSSADPFGADEWGDDEHDLEAPTAELNPRMAEQAAPAATLPPKPSISAAEAARTAPGKTQQTQPVQSPATLRERDGSAKADTSKKKSLGQVVGAIREERTQAAKKDAAARQAQRDAGLTPETQAPQMPTGRSR